MRENRLYGSEGGEDIKPSLPLSNPITVDDKLVLANETYMSLLGGE